MKLKTKLLYLAAFLVIALPLVMTGNAGAGYYWDGAVQNGATGGWITPNDMVCINGVRTDGTLDVVPGVTNSRQCIYNNTGLTGMDPTDVTATSTCGSKGALPCNVQANCTGTRVSTKGSLSWVAAPENKCYDSAPCTVAGAAGNDGAKHSVTTSICVDGAGNGIPLTDLDRTAQMCAALGGTWKQTSATAPSGFAGTFPTPGYGGSCVAYGRQFKGQDANGTPLPFGPKGTSAVDAGFCYATMNMTTAYPTTPPILTPPTPAVITCPVIDSGSHPNGGFNSSTAYDWSFTTPPKYDGTDKCTYAKGIKGYPNSSLTKADGTTRSSSTWLDLSTFTTMGDCLTNGGSWANWAGQPALGTTSVATTPLASTIPNWDFTRQAPDPDNGCLHCHSSLTQYNGPAERMKDSYLKQGHKNMLRKVTAGKIWAGPNEEGVITGYTSAATGSLDFTNATANINGTDYPLLYVFGDWMAPAPAGLDVIVNVNGSAKYNGTSNYSCAACHTTGWSNSSAGLCSLSSKTTSLDCTGAGGIWYPLVGVEGIGTPGFTPAQPGDSFPGITFTQAGKWVRDGIQCSRCHNAVVPKVVDTQIAASQFPSTHVTGSGMGALADGVGRTNLCFGCHQSIAKTNNGIGLDADLSHPENIPVKNAATAPAYVPEFNGHVIGNSFLNSPHAKFTGNIVPNALGKYDLEDPTTSCTTDSKTGVTSCTGGNNNGNASKYDSQFQGYTCWQSPTSSSPAKTMIVGGGIREIKTKTDCETLYGPGSWRTDTQGTCVTCHDVHNSLFVEETREAALRKVCTDCHNKSLSSINHLNGPGTPLGNLAGTSEAWEACVTCHMPRATESGFPMHLWRINTAATYRTFPTAKEFGIGAPATKKIANAAPDGLYTNAVWVDVDYVCGQCHGGGFGPTATQNSAPYFTKAELSRYAKGMHGSWAPKVSFTSSISHLTVTLTDASTGDYSMFSPTIAVNWGDGTSYNGNSGERISHTYPKAKTYTIVYTVTDSDGAKVSKKIKVVAKK